MVRRAVGIEDRGAFAQRIGVAKNTIAHYERGERAPTADVLYAYRQRFGVDLNWLVLGEGEMFLEAKHVVPFSEGGTSDLSNVKFVEVEGVHNPLAVQMVHLPRFDVEASAGTGSKVLTENRLGDVAFDRQFLKDRGASPDACTVIRAKGDSMSPTIPDGSLLVVDHSQKDVAHGYITVIGIGDDLLVKRVRRRLDGTVELISDNQAYPPEVIGTDRLDQLRVVGRVVYFCRVP